MQKEFDSLSNPSAEPAGYASGKADATKNLLPAMLPEWRKIEIGHSYVFAAQAFVASGDVESAKACLKAARYCVQLCQAEHRTQLALEINLVSIEIRRQLTNAAVLNGRRKIGALLIS